MPAASTMQSDRGCRGRFVILLLTSSLLIAISSSAQDVHEQSSGSGATTLAANGQSTGGGPASAHKDGRISSTISTSDRSMITGSILDADEALIPGATVAAESLAHDLRTVITDQDGVFELTGLPPTVSYVLHVNARGFAAWTSQPILLVAGERVSLTDIHLRIASEATVTVTASAADIASAQLNFEEQQRILGIIPNFYVTYQGDKAAPLTPGMKFQLAYKVATDPVTVVGMAFIAGVEQASRTPNYQLGARGYGQRFGAVAATGGSDILIGGAILPSLLHQDPRYFYQGTGTKRSRMAHALLSPFITRGDDGRSQFHVSSMGGDLASSALQTTYLPASDQSVWPDHNDSNKGVNV